MQKTLLGLLAVAIGLFGLSWWGERFLPQPAANPAATEPTEDPANGTSVLDPKVSPQEAVTPLDTSQVRQAVAAADRDLLSQLAYQKQTLYTVDGRTILQEGDVNAKALLDTDLTLDAETEGPQILIFHTHGGEMYADSQSPEEGVFAVGEELKTQLESYGIQSLHCEERFDQVDGKSMITGAYERMEPAIRQILEENPSIQVVIDIHRDGVKGDVRLETEINGVPTAQIMFFNGLCKTVANGQPVAAEGLSNPYLTENLAFSLQLQIAASALYPGLCRKIYLNAYRYSLHMQPRSLLVEVGAQTNTLAEAKAAMGPLAALLAGVLQ